MTTPDDPKRETPEPLDDKTAPIIRVTKPASETPAPLDDATAPLVRMSKAETELSAAASETLDDMTVTVVKLSKIVSEPPEAASEPSELPDDMTATVVKLTKIVTEPSEAVSEAAATASETPETVSGAAPTASETTKTASPPTRPNLLRAASGLTTQFNVRQTLPWRDVIYTPDIDKLLAETALDESDPDVAEQAARVIGRIRSQAAVKEIAQRQREGEQGALRALAYVADEALSLPRVVSVQARLYAMLANTWRRLTYRPMRGVWRLILALLGTWLAIGAYVWVNLPGLAIFNPDRWGKSVSWGLTIAVFMGVTVLIGSELPARLRGFWPWWLCALTSFVLGTALSALIWGAFTYFFLNYAPDWGLMLRGGLGLGIAFVITTLFYQMRGWLAVIITFLGIYVPLYLAFQGFWDDPVSNAAIIYFRSFEEVYTQLIPMALMMAIGAHAVAVWRDLRDLAAWVRGRLAKPTAAVEGS